MNTHPISLKFMIEKREGHGEDSNPLFLFKEKFCAVGVFDGMGGSGAATCRSEFGDNHTKAYVASRIIEEAVFCYMDNAKSVSDICATGIQCVAKSRLEQEKQNYPAKVSGLRSKLVREYPTTLAVVTCENKEDGSAIVNSYWAGDSRNYLWNSEGFFQISKDDLDTELDPLENLRNDGALSNCVCADREFEINFKSITVSKPFIILSATDGCFGYFPTPMHFHEVLLTGLKLSENVTAWENFIKKEICNVTGDDIALSLCAVGFEDFNSLKASFENEIIEGFDELGNLKNEISNLEISLDQKKVELEKKIQSEWNSYKLNYMKYIVTVSSNVEETEAQDNSLAASDPKIANTDDPNESAVSAATIVTTETKAEEIHSDGITGVSESDGLKVLVQEYCNNPSPETAIPLRSRNVEDLLNLIKKISKDSQNLIDKLFEYFKK